MLIYIGLFLVSIAGYILMAFYRAKYLLLAKNIGCLDLMHEILNVENLQGQNPLTAVNQLLRTYFKADASELLNVECGIAVLAGSHDTEGIENLQSLKEFSAALEDHEIKLVRQQDFSFYPAAAARHIQAVIFVPLLHKEIVTHVWVLEYRSTGREINFAHLCRIAGSLVPILRIYSTASI